jgi:hypothetical protein
MYTTTAKKPAVHDGLAIASLILSLLWLGGLGSLLAAIFGHSSMDHAKRAGRYSSGLAIAGAIIGWIGVFITVIICIVTIVTLMHTPSTQAQDYVNCINSQLATGYPATC